MINVGERTKKKLEAKDFEDTSQALLDNLSAAITPAEKAVVLEANQRKLIKAVAYLLGRLELG